MKDAKLLKIGEWLNTQGFDIDFDKDGFWLEDYRWGDHKTRDIIYLLEAYAQQRMPSIEEIKDAVFAFDGLGEKTTVRWPIPKNAPLNIAFYEGIRWYDSYLKSLSEPKPEVEWFNSKDRQPNEGETIIAKMFEGSRCAKITITGDFWDYGISEWKYPPYKPEGEETKILDSMIDKLDQMNNLLDKPEISQEAKDRAAHTMKLKDAHLNKPEINRTIEINGKVLTAHDYVIEWDGEQYFCYSTEFGRCACYGLGRSPEKAMEDFNMNAADFREYLKANPKEDKR